MRSDRSIGRVYEGEKERAGGLYMEGGVNRVVEGEGENMIYGGMEERERAKERERERERGVVIYGWERI